MRKLLSLPPNLVECFHDITGHKAPEWFCTSDPAGHKLGSGGGSAWLLMQAFENDTAAKDNADSDKQQHPHASYSKSDAQSPAFDEWLAADRRVLLHAGGQSRRLPAYAPSGKILAPIPVFRWERGQRLSQDLLSLQLPLYERIMEAAPSSLHTMIVSGDVYIRATEPLQPIPEADVVCYGLWLGAETAKDHGVFVSSRETPSELKCMLQKPSVQTLGELVKDHFYLTDIGIWLFSDRALKLLMGRSVDKRGELTYYDMYSDFGCCLGTEPTRHDEAVNRLRVAVLPLPGGEFYHFGTSHELLSSTVAIQNLVHDQRRIMHHSLKPHPAMFVQNAVTKVNITADNQNLWIENSYIGPHWTLARENIITGVPENDWTIELHPGDCVDIVPIGDEEFAVRPYGYYDKFAGEAQFAKVYPVTSSIDEVGRLLRYMLQQGQAEDEDLYRRCRHVSADDISSTANLRRLFAQRRRYRSAVWPLLARNYAHSVFYQIDLDDAAHEFSAAHLPAPPALPSSVPLLTRMHDAMFRSELARLRGDDGKADEEKAFDLLHEGIVETIRAEKQSPRLSVYSDQIVWGRSPVRIDLAGGWTDTPPYCLMEGGSVINMSIELNGQPPLQTYIRPCKEPKIVLRSIDLGAVEEVDTFEQLADFCRVGSPFSIPKAALALAGFVPDYCARRYDSLRQQLTDFGSGIEVTSFSAIPAGSGLGASSLLAATVLGALADFCGLGWDKNEIGRHALVLEQLLTSGGGWQDQFGGLVGGVKLLQTSSGFSQNPVVRWLPSTIFTNAEYRPCHLLYYTGITRTAKKILVDIVRNMFLNQHDELSLLRQMKAHTMQLYDAIQRGQFEKMGRLVRKTWEQNQTLDHDTNPEPIRRLTELVDDFCLGYKLPGAGGGGYLYMIAKDPDAAARIRQTLQAHRLNGNARFVEMTLSDKGLQVSRS